MKNQSNASENQICAKNIKNTLDANIKNQIYGMIYKFDIKFYRIKHRKGIKLLEIVFIIRSGLANIDKVF